MGSSSQIQLILVCASFDRFVMQIEQSTINNKKPPEEEGWRLQADQPWRRHAEPRTHRWFAERSRWSQLAAGLAPALSPL